MHSDSPRFNGQPDLQITLNQMLNVNDYTVVFSAPLCNMFVKSFEALDSRGTFRLSDRLLERSGLFGTEAGAAAAAAVAVADARFDANPSANWLAFVEGGSGAVSAEREEARKEVWAWGYDVINPFLCVRYRGWGKGRGVCSVCSVWNGATMEQSF